MTAPKAAASVSGTSSSKVKGSVLQGHSNILALNLDLQSTVIRKKCQSESVCVCVCVWSLKRSHVAAAQSVALLLLHALALSAPSHDFKSIFLESFCS